MALIFDVIVVLTASTLIAAQNVMQPLTTASPSAPKLNKTTIIDAKVTTFTPSSNETQDTITSSINVSVPLPPKATSGVKTTSSSSPTEPFVTPTTYYITTVPTTKKTTTSKAFPPPTTITTSTVVFVTKTTTTVRSTTVFPRNSSTTATPTTENDETTTTELPSTTPVPPEEPNAWLSVFLSVFILLAVILLIGVAAWFIRRRRQLERLRHQLMPMYNFDPTDDVDDWENQLLEEERSLRPEADKVQMYTGNSTFDPSQRAPSNMTSND